MADFMSASAPAELLVEILSYSTTKADVLAFALTCKHMRGAWEDGGAGLRCAWNLIQDELPAAELALVAIRAGQVVADAEDASCSPPKDIQLTQLESEHRSPNGTELVALYDAHELALAIAARLTRDNNDYYFDDSMRKDLTDRQPAIHRAIYRSFIVSSSLAGIYMEPVMEALRSSDAEIQAILSAERLSHRQLDFLEQYPAYKDKTSAKDNHELFGTLGDWLLDNILSQGALREDMERSFTLGIGYGKGCQARNQQNWEPEYYEDWDLPSPCPVKLSGDEYTHADAHLVALELVRTFWVCRKMLDMGWCWDTRPDDQAETGTYSLLAPFGWFGAARMALSMHTAGQDSVPVPRIHVDAYSPGGKGDMIGDGLWKSLVNFDIYYELDDEIVYVAPLLFKLFHFFLRRHLQSDFKTDFFRHEDGGEVYAYLDSFMDNLEIFATDDGEDAACYYPLCGDFRYAEFLDGTDVLTTWDQVRDVRRRLGLHVEDDADES
ncbi:hypothetical protein VHEMI05788 [[Torrubiella] hemipterigena]|uniref:F-box domain-containing protein n=1 Tax=[Torrubiella] hemipterigena TaxID=1531966 RepID=A0A0A1T578_9HYPO|nr:hypothetical protein VHEMI05788 [[Torrubiella] hemipterigena]